MTESFALSFWLKIKNSKKILFIMNRKGKKFEVSIIILWFQIYVFACTCKKTNPKANPKRVIRKEIVPALIISCIFLKLNVNSFFY